MMTQAAQTHLAGHMRPAGRVFLTPGLGQLVSLVLFCVRTYLFSDNIITKHHYVINDLSLFHNLGILRVKLGRENGVPVENLLAMTSWTLRYSFFLPFSFYSHDYCLNDLLCAKLSLRFYSQGAHSYFFVIFSLLHPWVTLLFS